MPRYRHKGGVDAEVFQERGKHHRQVVTVPGTVFKGLTGILDVVNFTLKVRKFFIGCFRIFHVSDAVGPKGGKKLNRFLESRIEKRKPAVPEGLNNVPRC